MLGGQERISAQEYLVTSPVTHTYTYPYSYSYPAYSVYPVPVYRYSVPPVVAYPSYRGFLVGYGSYYRPYPYGGWGTQYYGGGWTAGFGWGRR